MAALFPIACCYAMMMNAVVQDDYMRAEFLMANELISVILAAVVEQPAISTILRELQSEVGNEIHIHPAARFIR